MTACSTRRVRSAVATVVGAPCSGLARSAAGGPRGLPTGRWYRTGRPRHSARHPGRPQAQRWAPPHSCAAAPGPAIEMLANVIEADNVHLKVTRTGGSALPSQTPWHCRPNWLSGCNLRNFWLAETQSVSVVRGRRACPVSLSTNRVIANGDNISDVISAQCVTVSRIGSTKGLAALLQLCCTSRSPCANSRNARIPLDAVRRQSNLFQPGTAHSLRCNYP